MTKVMLKEYGAKARRFVEKYIAGTSKSSTAKTTFRRNRLLSVPVLKVHVMTGVTLSIKNLWGCYLDTMRCLHHQNFDRKIALITKLLDPKREVIDGIYALDNHGLMYGEPVKMNLILVANNPVVADALGAEIMGIPLEKAKHISVAEREGIGTTNLREVKINDGWEQFKRQFQIRKMLLDKASWLLFSSDALAKLVMDSPFTPLDQKVWDGMI